MNEEKLKWQKKDKLNFTKLLEQITNATVKIAEKEMKEINSKIEILHNMGFIKDDEQFQELQRRMKELNFDREQK